MDALRVAEGFDIIEEQGPSLGATFRDAILTTYSFSRNKFCIAPQETLFLDKVRVACVAKLVNTLFGGGHV